jgi:hypothetical protein
MTSNAEEPGKDQATAALAAVRGRAQSVKLPVYKHLLDINAGFDQVIARFGRPPKGRRLPGAGA